MAGDPNLANRLQIQQDCRITELADLHVLAFGLIRSDDRWYLALSAHLTEAQREVAMHRAEAFIRADISPVWWPMRMV